MSTDIYAMPDLAKKVRYNKGAEEERGEWEESSVVIYESADTYKDDQPDLETHEPRIQYTAAKQDGGPHPETQLPAAQRRTSRAAAVSLGLLGLLLLAGIIVLFIQYVSVFVERNNLVLERDKLNTSRNQLQTSFNNVTEEKNQLQTRYVNLTREKNQLQTRYVNLTRERDQLKGQIEGLCPGGWKRSGCSCYYKSTQKKTWWESRNDCQGKGAHLVVINNDEEQDFVSGLNQNGASWIGLRTVWISGRSNWEWEWVDGSLLTVKYWKKQTSSSYDYCAVIQQEQGQGYWTPMRCYNTQNHWICEKKTSSYSS